MLRHYAERQRQHQLSLPLSIIPSCTSVSLLSSLNLLLLCLLWASDLCIKAWLHMKQWWWRLCPLCQWFILSLYMKKKKTTVDVEQMNLACLGKVNQSVFWSFVCMKVSGVWKNERSNWLPVCDELEQNNWLRVQKKTRRKYCCRHIKTKKVYSWDIHFLLATLLFLLSPVSWITGEYILSLVNNVKFTSYLTSAWRKPVSVRLVYLIEHCRCQEIFILNSFFAACQMIYFSPLTFKEHW